MITKSIILQIEFYQKQSRVQRKQFICNTDFLILYLGFLILLYIAVFYDDLLILVSFVLSFTMNIYLKLIRKTLIYRFSEWRYSFNFSLLLIFVVYKYEYVCQSTVSYNTALRCLLLDLIFTGR